MTKTSLSSLYRRLTSQNVAMPAALDAADLAGAADGTLASERRESVAHALAASPAYADLVHALRDLNTESETLSASVLRTNRETAHRRQQRDARRVSPNRRFGGLSRWAAVAACLVAVVGAWTVRQSQMGTDVMPVHAQKVARADEIFNTRDKIFGVGMESSSAAQHGQKSHSEGDHLFHGDFSGG